MFGENLADRVVQRSISEENAEDGSASPDSTEHGNSGVLDHMSFNTHKILFRGI